MMASAAAVVVKEVWVYPLKSGRGLSLPAATIGPTGFAFDRQWMLVSSASGRFLSQRTHPKLATVVPSVSEDHLQLTPDVWPDAPADAAVTFSSEHHIDLEPLRVPLRFHVKQAWKNVKIWEWKGAALDEGDEAAEWFSKALDEPDIRLVRHVGSLPMERVANELESNTITELDISRPTDARFAEGFYTAFADGFPYLLASETSLCELNRRLEGKGEKPLPMTRFRPNIIIGKADDNNSERSATRGDDQLSPFVEDTWDTISFSGDGRAPVRFKCVKPCSRCKVTTTDQKSGVIAGREPLDELRNFRTPLSILESDVFQTGMSKTSGTENLQIEFITAGTQGKKVNKEVYFGVNCISLTNGEKATKMANEVHVGDAVNIG